MLLQRASVICPFVVLKDGTLIVAENAPIVSSALPLAQLVIRHYMHCQELLIDGRDNIFVSDDYANSIVEYTPS